MALNNEHYLTMQQLKRLLPFSSVHIYRLMKRGEFPQRVKLSARRVAWRKLDVDAWCAQREQASGLT